MVGYIDKVAEYGTDWTYVHASRSFAKFWDPCGQKKQSWECNFFLTPLWSYVTETKL